MPNMRNTGNPHCAAEKHGHRSHAWCNHCSGHAWYKRYYLYGHRLRDYRHRRTMSSVEYVIRRSRRINNIRTIVLRVGSRHGCYAFEYTYGVHRKTNGACCNIIQIHRYGIVQNAVNAINNATGAGQKNISARTVQVCISKAYYRALFPLVPKLNSSRGSFKSTRLRYNYYSSITFCAFAVQLVYK